MFLVVNLSRLFKPKETKDTISEDIMHEEVLDWSTWEHLYYSYEKGRIDFVRRIVGKE